LKQRSALGRWKAVGGLVGKAEIDGHEIQILVVMVVVGEKSPFHQLLGGPKAFASQLLAKSADFDSSTS